MRIYAYLICAGCLFGAVLAGSSNWLLVPAVAALGAAGAHLMRKTIVRWEKGHVSRN